MPKISPKEIADQAVDNLNELVKNLEDLVTNGKFKKYPEYLFYSGIYKSLKNFKNLRDQISKKETKNVFAADFLGDVLLSSYTGTLPHKMIIGEIKQLKKDLKMFLGILNNDPDMKEFNSIYIKSWMSLLTNISKKIPKKETPTEETDTEESELEVKKAPKTTKEKKTKVVESKSGKKSKSKK